MSQVSTPVFRQRRFRPLREKGRGGVLLFAFLFAAATAAASAAASGETAETRFLRLKTGPVDPLECARPDTPSVTGSSSRLAARSVPGEGAVHLLQFATPPDRHQLEALSRTGVRLVRPIPDTAWLVVLPGDEAKRAALESRTRALAATRWLGPVHPHWKVDPALRDPGKRARRTPPAFGPDTQEAKTTPEKSERFRVSLFALDVGPETSRLLSATFAALGARVVRSATFPTGTRITLELERAEDIDALALLDAVVWMEPWREPRRRGERAAQNAAGTIALDGTCVLGPGQYASWLDTLGLGGKGFVAHIMDDGLSKGIATNEPGTAHPDLLGRIAGIDNPTSDPAGDGGGGHGHLNASILMGQPVVAEHPIADAEGFLFGQGVAPHALIYSTKIFRNSGRFDIGSQSFIDLVARASRAGALVSANSWGSDTYGGYDLDSEEFDWLTRDADPDTPGYQPMTFVFASGNSGPEPMTIGSPATAKNVVSVGATETCGGAVTDGCGVPPSMADNIRELADFSSRGPTKDGRLGPTLVAPGTQILGAASDSPNYDKTGVCGIPGPHPDGSYYPPGQTAYTMSSGTSHSTPVVAGAAILFMEYYENLFGVAPSPALVRGALTHTARDLAGASDNAGRSIQSAPDNLQGWGRLDVGALVAPDRPFVFLDQSVVLEAAGQAHELVVHVEDPTRPLRATLTWTDPPASPMARPTLLNDLDLTVRRGEALWLGNVFENGVSVPGGEPDRVNPIEAVVVDTPAPGFYAIRVEAAALRGDALHLTGGPLEQDFALVVSNARRMGSRGAVAFGRERVRCTDVIEVFVADTDLAGAGSLEVEVAVVPGGDVENPVLLETPPGSGWFTATILVRSGPPAPGNGVLEVAHDSVLRAVYFDDDDGTGQPREAEALAHVDCRPPVVLERRALAVTDSTARLRFRTDEPARLELYFGDTPTTANLPLVDPRYRTEHTPDLADLDPCSLYYFGGVLIDEAGNRTRLANVDDFGRFVTRGRIVLFADDLESGGAPGWTHSADQGVSDWRLLQTPHASSPLHAWFSADVPGLKDAFLVSPPLDLPPNTRLEFHHTFGFEAEDDFLGYDGGTIEISTDGGATWNDLGPQIVAGGYTHQISPFYSSPIAGREAWSGGEIGPMTQVLVDLAPFEGPARRVRWRLACDESVGALGWYLDDIRFLATQSCAASVLVVR